MAKLTETELRLEMAKDALEYISTRKPASDDPRELRAFIADLQETARIELKREF